MAGSLELRFWTIPQTIPSTEPHHPEFGILLMGVSGEGKSATGNAIVGRKSFKSHGGPNSVTKKYDVAHTTLEGHVIKVVDTPGFADTDEGSDKEKFDLVVRALTNAVCKFPNGFHAVLLVMSYVMRRTKETKKNACDMYKAFDEEAFRAHGILVVTNGDAFKRDHEDDDMTLESWLKKDFPEILGICGGRCLLFNNVTTNADEKYNQNMQLLAKIKSFGNKGPYIPFKIGYQEQDKKSLQEAVKLDYISTRLGLVLDRICKKGIDKKRETREMDHIKRLVESVESPALRTHCYGAIDKLKDLFKRNEETQNKIKKIITRAQKELVKETSKGSWWNTVSHGVAMVLLPVAASCLMSFFPWVGAVSASISLATWSLWS